MDQRQQSGESDKQTPLPNPPPYHHGARLENISLEELEVAAVILDHLIQGANPLRETVREGRKTP